MKYWNIRDWIVMILMVAAAGCIGYADYCFFVWLFKNYFCAGIFWTGLHLFQIAYLVEDLTL